MKEAPAIYLGQVIDKKNFRTFIYASNNQKKLVESWEEFQKHVSSGLWFARNEDAIKNKKSKSSKKTSAISILNAPLIE